VQDSHPGCAYSSSLVTSKHFASASQFSQARQYRQDPAAELPNDIARQSLVAVGVYGQAVDHQIFTSAAFRALKIASTLRTSIVLAFPRDVKIPEDKDVHLRTQKTIEGFLRATNHRFVFVEGSIKKDGAGRQMTELRDQSMVERIRADDGLLVANEHIAPGEEVKELSIAKKSREQLRSMCPASITISWAVFIGKKFIS